jgi:hypothetical protein
MTKLPLPQLFPPGRNLNVEQLSEIVHNLVNELQRWFTRTSPPLLDDTFHPIVTRQTVGPSFTIEPKTFNIELTSNTSQTTDITHAIANGTDGQVILLQNITASFSFTIKNNATTKLNGGADYVMGPFDTLMLKWDGAFWVEVARSNN